MLINYPAYDAVSYKAFIHFLVTRLYHTLVRVSNYLRTQERLVITQYWKKVGRHIQAILKQKTSQ